MYYNLSYKEAVKRLESKDLNSITEGIKALRGSGKPEAVKLVVDVLRNNGDNGVQNECIKFINDIKDQQAVKYLMECIEDKKNSKILNFLVSCAWQNNLDYTQHLNIFVHILLTKEYLTAYEAFSVIENNVDKLDISDAENIIQIIEKGLTDIDNEKRPMVKDMIETIKDIKGIA